MQKYNLTVPEKKPSVTVTEKEELIKKRKKKKKKKEEECKGRHAVDGTAALELGRPATGSSVPNQIHPKKQHHSAAVTSPPICIPTSPEGSASTSLHLSLPSLRPGPSPQRKKAAATITIIPLHHHHHHHHHHHLHQQQQRHHHHPALLQLASVSLSQSAWGPEIRSLFRGLVCTCGLPCGVLVGLVGEVGIVIVVILLLLAWVASGVWVWVWVWDLHALVVVEKRRLGFAEGGGEGERGPMVLLLECRSAQLD